MGGDITSLSCTKINRWVHFSWAQSAAVTLCEYSYGALQGGDTAMAATQHLSGTETAVTKTTFDYAGRPKRVDRPDGTSLTSAYNANGTLASSTDANGNTTFFEYDGLNRQVRQWSPVGAGTYEYSSVAYDKAGRTTQRAAAKGTVANGAIPASGLLTSTYAYNAGGQLYQESTSGGARTAYTYDANGNLSGKQTYYDASNSNQEHYTYNSMDQLETSATVTQCRDIHGHADTTASLTLTWSYTYDKNGNLLTVTNPGGVSTTYTYDHMDRQLTASQPGIDENGAAATITTSRAYNWAGDAVASVDGTGPYTGVHRGTVLLSTLLSDNANISVPVNHQAPSVRGRIIHYELIKCRIYHTNAV